MGSFGMDWSQKGSVLWDWENLPPIGANGNDTPKMIAPLADAKFVGVEAPRHGSVHSSCGTFSSSSDMGYGSSKSSISASIDSSPKVGNTMELHFAPARVPDKYIGKNIDLGKADDARTSPSSVIAVSSGEPVLSLKLGKRTYFEDACGGQSAKSSPSDSSIVNPPPDPVKKAKASSIVTPPPAPAKKAKAAQNMQNSNCQVEGCKIDLSSAKGYHRKHKVCEAHSKAPKVVVAGLERRFCQQCSRFHGLDVFDQKKRSCRRRLNDHNARRRKPQPEAISFGSSRLSAMFYDGSQQASLLFGQAPYGQMRSRASYSWDNLGGSFKFAETKTPWLKPAGAAGIDDLHLSSQQVWNNIIPHGAHQDFDGVIAFKGTSAKVPNQGVEASVVVSDPNGNPDLQRAHSLLSNSLAGAGKNQPNTQLHPGLSTLASTSNAVMQQASSLGLWQDGATLDLHARFQALDPLGKGSTIATSPELQLPRPLSYNGPASHHDLMH